MKKRVLVLGGAGMAGHMVTLYLRENGHDVETLSARSTLDQDTHIIDVTDTKALTEFLTSQNYDVVINCVGILISQSDDNNALAILVNGYFPKFLERFYQDKSTKLIHLSTDCVFSGRNAPYKEDDFRDGDSVYDRSKALGEVKNSKDLTFRMSIIGPEIKKNGTGLLHWFWNQQGEVSGYSKAIWNGVTTLELARAINQAINDNLTGLYHLVPETNISKFDLLKLVKSEYDIENVNLAPNDSVVVDKTLINTRTDFDFKVKSYPEMLSDLHSWMQLHSDIYSHYQLK